MKNLLLILLVCMVLVNCNKKETEKINAQPKTDNSIISGYKVGDTASDFKLKNIDDQYISLANYNDAKGFIVIFTCNHCPYAKAYEDRIIALNTKYAALGYPVIAINPNNPKVQPEDSFEEMKIRATEKGFAFPYLFDEGQQVYPQYGATKTPHVFILQKNGSDNIVKYIGTIDNNYTDANDVSEKYVEAAVDALLAGKEVNQTNTLAIGCSIKV
jgi:peroxiredoxin